MLHRAQRVKKTPNRYWVFVDENNLNYFFILQVLCPITE